MSASRAPTSARAWPTSASTRGSASDGKSAGTKAGRVFIGPAPYPERRRFAATSLPPLLALTAIIGLMGLSACGGTTAATKVQEDRKFRPAPGLRQRGIASYYSSHLAGRPTASGQPYRPEKLTAAHRFLPIGTRVKVTRVGEDGTLYGPSVTVLVNDRGPFSKKRILDLSLAAARVLGMLRSGVARVEVEVVSSPPKR